MKSNELLLRNLAIKIKLPETDVKLGISRVLGVSDIGLGLVAFVTRHLVEKNKKPKWETRPDSVVKLAGYLIHLIYNKFLAFLILN